MNSFLKTKNLIEAVEEHLVEQEASSYWAISWLQRRFVFPIRFLKLGVSARLAGASFWSVSAFALMLLGIFSLNSFGIKDAQLGTFVILVAEIIPLLLVMFAMPSTYASSGVGSDDVEVAYAQIKSTKFLDSFSIDALVNAIGRFEKTARSRVLILKSFVTLLWAFSIYLVNAGINTKFPSNDAAVSFYFQAAILFIITAGTYLLAWGYEASVDRLFKSLYFGCDECRSVRT